MDYLGDAFVSTDWERLELPGGRHLLRDEVYGFLKVMPRPSDEEIASFYETAYRNPCVPHDPDGRAEDHVAQVVPILGKTRGADVGGERVRRHAGLPAKVSLQHRRRREGRRGVAGGE